MHRHRKALISYGARFNSTAAEASTATFSQTKRRGIPLRWGNVIIPSREEILNLKIPKAPVYSPDLSYLKKAPQSSLAVRLVKPKFQPKDISALTEKRRVERLTREQKEAESSAKRIEERLARDAKKAHNFNEAIRTVQDNADKLNSLSPLLNSPGPLPLAQSRKPPVERPDDELSPSALKRREERRLREVNQDRRPPRKNKERSRESQSGGMKLETAATENLDSVDSAELEAASPTVHAPEFNGPESISETIDGFSNVVQPGHQPSAHGQHSIKLSESSNSHLNPNIIDSLAGGDYSGYTSLSSTSNSISPNALTVVNTAELALSHQRDYIIPQRKRAIEIVKTLVGANFVQATKENQTTA